jgi:CRISPR type I-E-associated protein CasB/Cse2
MTEFVDYLESLKEDRAAMAALRRGLGYTADDAPAETRRIIEPRLSQTTSPSWERACYLVGPLFAFHPESTGSGDMGAHLRAIRGDDPNETAVERRFTQLLAAHPDDLADYLRQAVSLLKSKDQPINWRVLFQHICNWDHPTGYVQKTWARSFWRASFDKPADDQTDASPEKGE